MINEPGLTLAYIGDAVYELKIREYLINEGITSVNNLHKSAINFTSAIAQSRVVDHIFDILNEEEVEYYKRGRNATIPHKPRSASLKDYIKATGFEALIGYLYLNKNTERLDEIIQISINFLKSENR